MRTRATGFVVGLSGCILGLVGLVGLSLLATFIDNIHVSGVLSFLGIALCLLGFCVLQCVVNEILSVIARGFSDVFRGAGDACLNVFRGAGDACLNVFRGAGDAFRGVGGFVASTVRLLNDVVRHNTAWNLPRGVLNAWSPGGATSKALSCASRLLPAAARDQYVEEWQRWLYDLRITGEPWYRWLGEVLSILLSVPRLALALRTSRQVVE